MSNSILPYDIPPSTDGRNYYKKMGGNGEAMNTSQMYDDTEGAIQGMLSDINRTLDFAKRIGVIPPEINVEQTRDDWKKWGQIVDEKGEPIEEVKDGQK